MKQNKITTLFYQEGYYTYKIIPIDEERIAIIDNQKENKKVIKELSIKNIKDNETIMLEEFPDLKASIKQTLTSFGFHLNYQKLYFSNT